MKCKVSGCPYNTIYKTIDGPTNWTVGETTTPKECRGFPMNPIEPLNICYYHFKQKEGYYDSDKYCGKASNPTTTSNSGKKRVLGTDWR